MCMCPGCHEKVRWFHKKGGGKYTFNSDWHRRCAYAWDTGYSLATNFINEQLGRFGLPFSEDLYQLNQPQPQPEEIFLRKRVEFRQKYNIGEDNFIKINL